MALPALITCADCGKEEVRAKNATYCRCCSNARGNAKRKERGRYFYLAHEYVAVAVRNGDLPKLDGSITCADCSNPAAQYDHRDYKKPLEVDPVCRVCNAARGPGLHRDPSETGTKPLSLRKRFELKAA